MERLVAVSLPEYPCSSSSGWKRKEAISRTVSSTKAGIDQSTTLGRFGMTVTISDGGRGAEGVVTRA